MTDCQPFDSLRVSQHRTGRRQELLSLLPPFLSRLEPGTLVGDGARETAREYSKGGKGMIAICENESLGQD